MRQQIGFITVDSGTVIIADPCYLWPKDARDVPVAVNEVGYWQSVAAHMMGKETISFSDLGIVVRSTHGDGTYPVYADIARDGRIRSVTVVFDEEEDAYNVTQQWAEVLV